MAHVVKFAGWHTIFASRICKTVYKEAEGRHAEEMLCWSYCMLCAVAVSFVTESNDNFIIRKSWTRITTMSPVSAGRYPVSAQSTLSHAPRHGGMFTCLRHLGNSILFTNTIHLDNLTKNILGTWASSWQFWLLDKMNPLLKAKWRFSDHKNPLVLVSAA